MLSNLEIIGFWLSLEFFSSNYFQIGQHVVLLHIQITSKGKYTDFVPSIYPFNKPEEGWCWPAEIL